MVMSMTMYPNCKEKNEGMPLKEYCINCFTLQFRSKLLQSGNYYITTMLTKQPAQLLYYYYNVDKSDR